MDRYNHADWHMQNPPSLARWGVDDACGAEARGGLVNEVVELSSLHACDERRELLG